LQELHHTKKLYLYFWEQSTAKLAMPATHSKSLPFSSEKLVTDYNAIEKKDEKLGSNSRYKKKKCKGK